MAAETLVGAVGLNLTVELLKHVAPKGIAYASTWLRGKELLVVGQARAGKTTFIDYLQYGIFEDEQETNKTYETQKSPTFKIEVGGNATLELRVRRAVDVPGQIGPVAHAQVAFDRKPHGIIIFTDLTTPLRGESDRASATWLSEFCDHLETQWSIRGRSRNGIESLVVVMNKADKVDQKIITSRRNALRSITDKQLNATLGRIVRRVPIVPCISVTNPNGTKLLDSIIINIAKAFAQ